MELRRCYLLLMSAIIALAALLYGFSPQWFALTWLGLATLDVNFAHVLRAVMGLYLGFGLFWLWAAFCEPYKNTAVLTAVVFTAGVAVGRLISIGLDGRPAPFLFTAPWIELGLALLGGWVFRRRK